MDSCFDPTDGGKDLFGWCATCDTDAKRGQRGYCGPGETSKEKHAPIIRSNSTNWGFCHKDCRSRVGDEDMLQARVHIKGDAMNLRLMFEVLGPLRLSFRIFCIKYAKKQRFQLFI